MWAVPSETGHDQPKKKSNLNNDKIVRKYMLFHMDNEPRLVCVNMTPERNKMATFWGKIFCYSSFNPN